MNVWFSFDKFNKNIESISTHFCNMASRIADDNFANDTLSFFKILNIFEKILKIKDETCKEIVCELQKGNSAILARMFVLIL